MQKMKQDPKNRGTINSNKIKLCISQRFHILSNLPSRRRLYGVVGGLGGKNTSWTKKVKWNTNSVFEKKKWKFTKLVIFICGERVVEGLKIGKGAIFTNLKKGKNPLKGWRLSSWIYTFKVPYFIGI